MFVSIEKTNRQFKISMTILRRHIFGSNDMCVEGDGEEFSQPYQEFLIDLHAAVEAYSAVLGTAYEITGEPATKEIRKYAAQHILDVLNEYLERDFKGDHEKMIKEYRLPDGLEYEK